MDLIMLVLTLAVIGCVVYLIVTYVPMPDIFKKVIMIIAAVIMIIYLLRTLGGSLPNVL